VPDASLVRTRSWPFGVLFARAWSGHASRVADAPGNAGRDSSTASGPPNVRDCRKKAQILIYRLHVQEAAVAHASQRLDEAKSSAEQLQARRKYQEIQIKQYETLKDRAENAAQRQQFEDAIFELKAQTEASAVEEQEAHSKASELEQQSRIEQAKLDQLQDELDRLDRAVMNAVLHTASSHQ